MTTQEPLDLERLAEIKRYAENSADDCRCSITILELVDEVERLRAENKALPRPDCKRAAPLPPA